MTVKRAKKTARDRMHDLLREMATSLHRTGDVDIMTLPEYIRRGLPKVKSFQSRGIKQIRKKIKVSQPVFAQLLNISTETVRKWERGERHPTGSSLKLLNLVYNHGIEALY